MGVTGEVLPWLVQPLDEALQRLRGHATLVHGPSGVGQLEFSMALASAWLCESGAGGPACGHCTGCRLIASRTHPDLQVLVPDALREALGWSSEEAPRDGEGKKAKPSKEIKVEAVRQAIAWTQQTSSRGRGKVLVIHPAQAMNPVTANALLKTLEEPPAGVRLLLSTSDAELLLPTLRSRCQRWALHVPDRQASLDWLGQQGMAEPQVLLDAAGGRPLDAAQWAAEGLEAGAWKSLPASVARGQAKLLGGWPVPRVVDALQKLCHDAMALAVGGSPRFFPGGSVPPGADLALLSEWARALSRAARHDEHPWNAPLLAEALVIEGARAWTGAAVSRTAAGRLATL